MVIKSRAEAPDWTGARCHDFDIFRDKDDPTLWNVHNDTWFQDAEEALPVCNGDYSDSPCPVRDACLALALLNNDAHGVFGGMTSPQRKWIRRKIPKEQWADFEFLRSEVPAPEHFSNYGNEDPTQEVALDAAAAEDNAEDE